MAELLSLRGRNALSPFRLQKLLASVADTRVAAISAEYWHFVKTTAALDAAQRNVLDRLLTYGPRTAAVAGGGEWHVVIPRPGTISPWASKATDIAHNCGLKSIGRIERGT